MPIIYSYPPTTFLSDEDTFVITKTIEEENTIETRSVSFEDLKKSIIANSTFIFTQGVAASVWDITHNMKKFPSVEVVDTGENSILGFQINYISSNRLTLTFITPFSGKAYLN